MPRKDAIILHGTMGSPEGNWFPWLKSQLENDYNVYVPQFPTPENQTKDNWHAECLQDQIGGELIVIPNGGHLNSESGYTEFPLLLNVITRLDRVIQK